LSTTGGKGQLFARLQSFESSQAKTASPSSSSSSPETVSGDKDVYEGDESSTGKRQPASKGRKPKKAMSTTRGKASNPPAASIGTETLDAPLASDNEADLLKLTKRDLQDMAIACGVSKSGTKPQLVDRILQCKRLDDSIPQGASPVGQVQEHAVELPAKTSLKRTKVGSPKHSKRQQSSPDPLKSHKTGGPDADGEQEQAEIGPASSPAHQENNQNLKPLKTDRIQPHPSRKQPPAQPSSSTSRRRLSPEEAARVLEDLVRQKGSTGAVGTVSLISPRTNGGIDLTETTSEVSKMMDEVIGFKAQLSMQEETTERLRSDMLRSEKIEIQREHGAVYQAQVAIDPSEKNADDRAVGKLGTSLKAEESSPASHHQSQFPGAVNALTRRAETVADGRTELTRSSTADVEPDTIKSQEALGLAVATGVIALGEVIVSVASVAGRLTQNWLKKKP